MRVPAAPLVVAEPKLLLELEIIALDPPPHLRELYHLIERRGLGENRQLVFAGLVLTRGPLDQGPFLGVGLADCNRGAPAARAHRRSGMRAARHNLPAM